MATQKRQRGKYSDDELVSIIPQRVRAAIELTGYSLSAAAQRLAEKQQTIDALFRCRVHRTRLSRLKKIAKLAGWPVTETWLRGGPMLTGQRAEKLGYVPVLLMREWSSRTGNDSLLPHAEIEALRLTRSIRRAALRDKLTPLSYEDVAALFTVDFWASWLESRPFYGEGAYLFYRGQHISDTDASRHFAESVGVITRTLLADWFARRMSIRSDLPDMIHEFVYSAENR